MLCSCYLLVFTLKLFTLSRCLINASNDETVDKVCGQFKMCQLEHIPEFFYTEKEKPKEGKLFRDLYRCLCIPF